MKGLIYLFTVTTLISCATKDDGPTGVFGNTKKILFIGNSHTSRNLGLDYHVTNFANSYDVLNLVKRTTQGGFTLEEHLTHPPTLSAIDEEDWDIIILQENTFRAINSPGLMLQSAIDFQNYLSTYNAQVFLYETWAYENTPQDQAAITTAYLNASNSTGFQIINVGTKWAQFMGGNTIGLFETDGVHSNENGTYLTASIFFKKLFNINDINETSYSGTIDPSIAATIREFVSQN